MEYLVYIKLSLKLYHHGPCTTTTAFTTIINRTTIVNTTNAIRFLTIFRTPTNAPPDPSPDIVTAVNYIGPFLYNQINMGHTFQPKKKTMLKL